ncbi:MAG: hypothetical protein JO005_03690 [Gammaproteobacteria bacterium]|nr:hypothetical protein [Gammaproteobacteria bacterium]
MNSFTLTAVGNLACDPQLVRHRDLHYARLCLIGNDFVGRSADGATREIATRLAFLAYGAMGEALVRHARKGDQLFLVARVRGNPAADESSVCEHEFVIEGFRFGAAGRVKREAWEAQKPPAAAAPLLIEQPGAHRS